MSLTSTTPKTKFNLQRVHALQSFRDRHPDVQVDASRDKGAVSLRGLPEALARAKNDLLSIQLESETRVLIGRQASAILVGKSGSTINRLVEEHQVTIDVSETGDDVFTATVIGNPVAAAMTEIDAILESNKAISTSITVDSIVRNTLLADAGAPIKALQKSVNEAIKDIGSGIQLSFAKEGKDHVLVVKGRRAAVLIAKELVVETIAKIQASLVIMTVDPFIIPKIIGKGGETINKLKNGKVVNIEVDKVSGRILIQSEDEAEVKRVEEAVNDIVAKNQINRITLSASSAKPMFRELVRSEKRDEINQLVWMGLDDDASAIILRGTRENVSQL
jgi:polyribonucleotide nucleotidyltransferase